MPKTESNNKDVHINIDNILQKGESISVEFKRAKNKLPENLFDTVCTFLNRNGGTVLLGVSDNGTVKGIDAGAVLQMKKDIAVLSNNPQKLFLAFLFDVQEVKFEGKWLIYLYPHLHRYIPATARCTTATKTAILC